MRVLVVVCLTACGRIGFDPGAGGGGGGDGGGLDGPTACPARDVDVGREHACLVDYTGGVYCWGHNASGQAIPPLAQKRSTGPVFLEGVTEHILAPQQVPLPGPARKVALGRAFSCALLEDGAVWCWGDNDEGQLGDGMTTEAGPSLVALGSAADDIAAGAHSACARLASDHSLMCWGDSRDGELGRLAPSTVPVAIANTAGTEQLGFGHRHHCAVLEGGAVRCWGQGVDGQTGGATNSATGNMIAIGPAVHVTASSTTSCGVEIGGAIKCWGGKSNGRLGDGGESEETAIPIATSVASTGVEVELGINGGCARLADKSVTCWGYDLKGDGTFASDLAPRASALVDASKLAAAYHIKCAIEGGRVVCWGPNEHGQLGRGTRALVATPVEVDVGGATILEVRAGHEHVCVRTPTAVRCWGGNPDGEVGRDGVLAVTSPVIVSTGLAAVQSLSISHGRSCVIGTGTARCWGASFGSSPTTLPLSGTAITATGHGVDHACMVVDNVTLCIGDNQSGQLGNGTTTDAFDPPTQVLNLPGVPSALAAGQEHTCALVAGAVTCWGKGGLVGDGTTQRRLEATPITIPGTVVQIAAGIRATLALTANGEVYCWGDNFEGECGLGDTDPRRSPTLVPLAPVAEISLTASTSCVRHTAGGVSCFGAGSFGQLGNGMTALSDTPVAVMGLPQLTQITAGDHGACGLAMDGRLFCWGSQMFLADGDNSLAQPLPVMLQTPCP